MINDQLIKVFDDAAKINPNDPELLVILLIFSLVWLFCSLLKDSMKFLLIYSIGH